MAPCVITHVCGYHKRERKDKFLFLIRSIQVVIQGDSGEKVSIFGGDNIGRCELKKSSHENVFNSLKCPGLAGSSGD